MLNIELQGLDEDGNEKTYKLSDFNTFLILLSKGVIGITFSIDVYKNEKRYGQMHDHGTTFNINKKDIEKLFIRIL